MPVCICTVWKVSWAWLFLILKPVRSIELQERTTCKCKQPSACRVIITTFLAAVMQLEKTATTAERYKQQGWHACGSNWMHKCVHCGHLACSFSGWLFAGADLFWEKVQLISSWWLVCSKKKNIAGSWRIIKPDEHDNCLAKACMRSSIIYILLDYT